MISMSSSRIAPMLRFRVEVHQYRQALSAARRGCNRAFRPVLLKSLENSGIRRF
jgi:hypothetical protein